MDNLSEKYIERNLVKAVKNAGGIALKFVSPGFDGMPDRILLFPKGKMAFAEIKAPGKNPRALQMSRHRMLRKLEFKVFVIDDIKEIRGVIDEIRTA